MQKLVTIFTPTYNRSDLLECCYKSLVSQTSKNFIWQIIDDGSTDDTESKVASWINESAIEIKYLKKNNEGKASAINLSVDITETELWLCLDSDDYLTDDAIAIIESNYPEIAETDSVCGVFSLRASPDGASMQGVDIPETVQFATQGFIRYILKIPPEYAHVFKTEVIKKFSYPVVDGEKYFPLSYVFDQLDQHYSYKIIHKKFMVCQYQSDGITLNKRNLIKKNPIGYMLYKRQLMVLAPTLRERTLACSTYVTGCLLSGHPRIVRDSPRRFLTLLCLPIGCLDYFLRYRFDAANVFFNAR
ncbi:glycosyltransferase family A protein [Halomonas cupida]|uniref:glycosyltransferase family A protein n=1 Tax=Halomonas cupida TaxID=44933 RepID=UPI003EF29C37